ncbi:hypothetical protein MAPG_09905 [Magnaporthiopsis poae ATCC 64411]|uniref:Uncharacterized protein n=1 Tax=Magnaporthiopsis poae (strain ATCC 64411 / 73-15) TaxID=644358 RepID=A0A0C4EB59_MAGP6|nr:hypothetical protein MAPG_09905 [Magnaporthiopsis poae ATCC 64411]
MTLGKCSKERTPSTITTAHIAHNIIIRLLATLKRKRGRGRVTFVFTPCSGLCLAFGAVSRRVLLRFVGCIELFASPLVPCPSICCRSDAFWPLIVCPPTDSSSSVAAVIARRALAVVAEPAHRRPSSLALGLRNIKTKKPLIPSPARYLLAKPRPSLPFSACSSPAATQRLLAAGQRYLSHRSPERRHCGASSTKHDSADPASSRFLAATGRLRPEPTPVRAWSWYVVRYCKREQKQQDHETKPGPLFAFLVEHCPPVFSRAARPPIVPAQNDSIA